MSKFINLMDLCWPVGSIYLSSQSTSPAEKFGGTWSERTSGEVLRASHTWSSTGQDNHTLTVNQIPSHKHTTNAWVLSDKGSWGSVSSGVGVPPTTGDSNNTNWNNGFLDVSNTGGGQSFSKLPKCLNLYCWIRIA